MTRPALDRGSIDALQDALATEHAALWSYSLAVAFLPAEQLAQARSDEAAHRALRGSVERTLAAAGVAAVSALPAYAPPQPVVDGPSARRRWRWSRRATRWPPGSRCSSTPSDRELRRTALDVLEDGTLRVRPVAGGRRHPPGHPALPRAALTPESPGHTTRTRAGRT